MGMFDSIMFYCPNCNKEIEAQSKSGDCLCGWYPYTQVPSIVAIDANRHAPFVCECGKQWKFKDLSPATVSLEIEEVEVPKRPKDK